MGWYKQKKKKRSDWPLSVSDIYCLVFYKFCENEKEKTKKKNKNKIEKWEKGHVYIIYAD